MISTANYRPYTSNISLQKKKLKQKNPCTNCNSTPSQISFNGTLLQEMVQQRKIFWPSRSIIKSFFKDPGATFYGIKQTLWLTKKSQSKIGEVELQMRGKNKKIKACIKKTVFSNTARYEKYSIHRRNLELGYILIAKTGEDTICVDYFTNVVGRDKYKNIEKILLQIVKEEALNSGTIPKIFGYAEDIGKNKFSRGALYQKMGMDYLPDDKLAFYKPEKVKEIMINLANKNKLIFPQTKETLDKLI